MNSLPTSSDNLKQSPLSLDLLGGQPEPVGVRDPLAACVHCGFCLEVCPTYQLTGDENNSPRGRLRLWKEEAAGRLASDPWTDFYTDECVGCLACETACPANVPYGEALEQVRHEHVSSGRSVPGRIIRAADYLARHSTAFNQAMLPVRALRRMGLLHHPKVFPGHPPVIQSTESYAKQLMNLHRPTGRRVALFTGCLMESVFREINFATVRVLIENNLQVIVPRGQTCCGAFQKHTGLGHTDALATANQQAFTVTDVDAVLTNSSGCGHALGPVLDNQIPVRDVIDYLEDLGPIVRQRSPNNVSLYLDLPCHLIHGQKIDRIPQRVLEATGYQWQLAPQARDCCGAGGTYHLQKPANAKQMIEAKSAFLGDAIGDPVVLVSMNHVCLMQWNSIRSSLRRSTPTLLRHLIQLLDPEANLKITPVSSDLPGHTDS